MSAIAAALHVRAAVDGRSAAVGVRHAAADLHVHRAGRPAGGRRRADNPASRRALWAAALSIFAVSALHLSQLHQGDASWPVELLGHHASLPLAVAILYQDFPFALADLFLKRALTCSRSSPPPCSAWRRSARFTRRSVPLRDPRDVGLLVTFWVATALLYPRLRDLIGWFVDSVLLHRPDYALLRARIGRRAQRQQDIAACSTRLRRAGRRP